MAKKAKPAVWSDNSAPWNISLHQLGKDRFSVVYGAQVDNGLTYGDAAKKLGEAIMHKAACNGHLENHL